jgi:hypothetical protein
MSIQEYPVNTSCGAIDEEGLLNSFMRENYKDGECIMELLANSLDSYDSMKTIHRKIGFLIDRESIELVDGATGMNMRGLQNMFSLNRENHKGDMSRGLAGYASKVATSNLSRKGKVLVFTREKGGDFLKALVPWDAMHTSKKYIGMIQPSLMNEDEKRYFILQRETYAMKTNGEAHGTTIRLPYDDDVKNEIETNFADVNTLCLKDPKRRIDLVFGREMDCEIFYKHFQEVETRYIRPYNYFGEKSSEYYNKGFTNAKIEHYVHKQTNKNRFICDYYGDTFEWDGKKIKSVKTNTQAYDFVGEGEVLCGLRYDPTLFDSTNPKQPENHKYLGPYNSKYFNDANNTPYLSQTKLVRNNQFIGYIDPETKAGNSRANLKSRFEIQMVQCEYSYRPISSQTNKQDDVMAVQKNKNQQDPSSIPEEFSQLIKEVKKRTSDSIWKYFVETIQQHEAKKQSELEAQRKEQEIARLAALEEQEMSHELKDEDDGTQTDEEHSPKQEDLSKEEDTSATQEETPKRVENTVKVSFTFNGPAEKWKAIQKYLNRKEYKEFVSVQ